MTKKQERENLGVMKYRLIKRIKSATWENIIEKIAVEIGMGFNTRREFLNEEKKKKE